MRADRGSLGRRVRLPFFLSDLPALSRTDRIHPFTVHSCSCL